MQSQIPDRAAQYFKLIRVDVAEHHPVVTAVFGRGKGWQPIADRKCVSHTYLVQLRESGVHGVQLTAGSHAPEWMIEELIGKMGPLDAEMIDGVPVSEGSGVKAKRAVIAEVLTAQGVSAESIDLFLDEADTYGSTEFVVEERGFSAVDPRGERLQGWRYRLTTASPPAPDESERAYDLSVVSHERKVA